MSGRTAEEIYTEVATRVRSRFLPRLWEAGDRIRLTRDGWGKMPAGTFGTVLKVFNHGPGSLTDYAVIWDTGVKDLVDGEMAERLCPLEQLASVV